MNWEGEKSHLGFVESVLGIAFSLEGKVYDLIHFS